MTRPVSHSVDSPHTEAWLPEIGKLIANFGAIELHTYWWIAALSRDPTRSKQILTDGTLFSARVDLIRKLLKDDEFEMIREEASQMWARSQELCELRNGIAHSPLVFHVPDDSDVADWVGVPDFGNKRSTRPTGPAIITLPDLIDTLNELCEIAEALYRLLEQVDLITADD